MAKIKIKTEKVHLLWDDENKIRQKPSEQLREQVIPDLNYSPIGELINIRREVNGRKGKPILVLYGFAKEANWYFEKICGELKRLCSTGGSFHHDQGAIEIQGEQHLSRIINFLEDKGMKIKKTGGIK